MDHTVFTCKQHHACLSFVSVHHMAPPQQLRQQTSNCSSLLIYRPRNDERLSWPSWLTYSGWFTHISGHPSATDREQDSESTPAKDRRSTAGPRNRRSGVALAMRHTLKWFIHLRAQGLSKGDEHPTNILHRVWYSLHFIGASVCHKSFTIIVRESFKQRYRKLRILNFCAMCGKRKKRRPPETSLTG